MQYYFTSQKCCIYSGWKESTRGGGMLTQDNLIFLQFIPLPFSFQEVLQPGKLQGVLTGLREIIITPIKPFSPPPSETTQGAPYTQTLTTEQPPTSVPPHPDDLASRITRVLGKGEWSYIMCFALPLQIKPKTCRLKNSYTVDFKLSFLVSYGLFVAAEIWKLVINCIAFPQLGDSHVGVLVVPFRG